MLRHIAIGLAILLLPAAAIADEHVSYRKGYVDGPYGQIHFHLAHPSTGPGEKTAVAFFHQNPKSAEEYRPLLEIMGQDRLVVAFDTPGYGESDRPDTPPDMAGIADAMAVALKELGLGSDGNGPVDVFGFHTGVFIASELAVRHPDLVRKVALSGIAYYPQAYRDERLASLPAGKSLPEDGTFILSRWHLVVINRAEGVSVDRAAKVFLEDIHSLDKSWFAYKAVWSYAPEVQFPKITQPILVLQPHELLTEQTLRAHREIIPHADLIELPDIVDDVFDTGPQEIADELAGWLDSE